MRETGDGYPDITMLPVIANYFKITVDELIGNDDIGRRADEEKFWERYNMLHDKPEEQLEHCRDYYRKYPEDFNNMVEIGYIITQNGMRKELPLLREVCEKIISSCTLQYHRQQAAEYMCMFCEDEELEQWLNLCAPSYEAFRGEVLEERF